MTRRQWWLWGLALLAIGTLSAVLAGMPQATQRAYDPENPEENGTQALVEVLRGQGVTVDVVRGLSQETQARIDEDTTVLLESTEMLAPDRGQDLVAAATVADRLVVLHASGNVGEVLDVPVSARSRPTSESFPARCDSEFWQDGDTLSGTQTLLEVTDPSLSSGGEEGEPLVTACFPPSASFGAGGTQAGYVVTLSATDSSPQVVLSGSPEAFTNGTIEEDANAATALRLLGDSARVLWVIPSPSDAAGQESQSLMDVLPRATVPSILLLLITLAALTFWRGRRLGPVVTEPLPVAVRALETTEGRAQLYRQSGDQAHALGILQQSARRRLANAVALPSSAPAEDVCRAVASSSGRDLAEVSRILADSRCTDDAALVRTARELQALEEEVRNPSEDFKHGE